MSIDDCPMPYGTTSFRCGGDYADGEDIYIDGTNVSRFVEVTLPNSGKELYLFQGDCTPDYLLTVEFFREVRACLRPGGVGRTEERGVDPAQLARTYRDAR